MSYFWNFRHRLLRYYWYIYGIYIYIYIISIYIYIYIIIYYGHVYHNNILAMYITTTKTWKPGGDHIRPSDFKWSYWPTCKCANSSMACCLEAPLGYDESQNFGRLIIEKANQFWMLIYLTNVWKVDSHSIFCDYFGRSIPNECQMCGLFCIWLFIDSCIPHG